MTAETTHRPRVGIPWPSASAEAHGDRRRYDRYLEAVRRAGGDPVEISLSLPDADLARLAASLDALLLPGAAIDVDPRRYGHAPHPATNPPDPQRERTDDALLDLAFAAAKPVLAICFGAQLLNVHLGGSLLQDIPSELPGAIAHNHTLDEPDAFHAARLTEGLLAALGAEARVRVNSAHHQAILSPGQGLRVTAVAPDGVIEAVEWTGGPGWVLGVQWHPERMPGDSLADALFRHLIGEARAAADRDSR